MTNLCPGVLWSLMWFVGLWIVGWPIAFFVAWLYIFLLPFGVCIELIRRLNEVLLRAIQLPLTFTENMMAMKPCC